MRLLIILLDYGLLLDDYSIVVTDLYINRKRAKKSESKAPKRAALAPTQDSKLFES